MDTVDERVAFLEGRMTEQSEMFAEIRRSLGRLEGRMDFRFTSVDGRFGAVDQRFDSVDRRFDSVDRRIDALTGRMDAGFASLDQKLDQRFTWVVGLQMATLVTIVAAVLTAFLAG